jgi:Zn-dependent protease
VHDSLRLGRIAGIPVGLHWSVVGMIVAVAGVLALDVLPSTFPDEAASDRWAAAAVGTVAFAASLLAHELGHAVLARRHGVGVDGITLWLLGGVARLTRQAPSATAELRIALAGPLASGAVGVFLVSTALLTRGADGGNLARAVVLWLGLVNVLLAVLNLLPGSPLDGGRVLSALLWRRTGDAERGRLLAARSGLVLGLAAVLLGLLELVRWERPAGWGTVGIGAFLLVSARSEVAAAVVRGRLRRTTMLDVMAPHPQGVPDWLTVDRFLQGPGVEEIVVFPVVRWDHRPVGWVSRDLAQRFPDPERSWTHLARAMVPDQQAPRAWASEPVDEVLSRLGDDLPQVVVVLDPRTRQVAGTVSGARLSALFRRPDLWGREPAAA